VPKAFFKDKIVMVGSSAIGLYDLKTTPLDRDYPGVELHATFVYNVLKNNYLSKVDPYLSYLIWLILIVVSLLIFTTAKLNRVVVYYAVIIILLLTAAYFLFSRGNLIFNSSASLMIVSISFLSSIIYRYGTEIREKQRVKKTFSKYVSSSIIDEMLENPDKLKLGGESKEVTALFSDIQNFTNLSEAIPPDKLGDFLKEYMTELTGVVFKYNGMLDKYIGDAIVALFGVPLNLDNHSEYACLAAIEMKKRGKEISRKHKSHEMFDKLATRIGINTGVMITGNMGSEQMFDYTAIGDNMNLAARLEGLNKAYSTEILISEFTKNKISNKFLCREIDLVKVKGKSKGIRVYELFDHIDLIYQHEADTYSRLKENFERALGHYYTGNWKEALDIFTEVKKDFPSDKPSEIMIARTNRLINEAPKDWDGSWVMREK
jgi:adenylate cyclase